MQTFGLVVAYPRIYTHSKNVPMQKDISNSRLEVSCCWGFRTVNFSQFKLAKLTPYHLIIRCFNVSRVWIDFQGLACGSSLCLPSAADLFGGQQSAQF